MSETELKKPEWDKFDNIFELMQSYTDTQWRMKLHEALTEKRFIQKPTVLGRGLVYDTVESYLQALSRLHTWKLPVWKILIPELEGTTGAIYYIVDDGTNSHIFRGTYGYSGTGVHESCLCEFFLTRIHNSYMELRSGDYLLGFLE